MRTAVIVLTGALIIASILIWLALKRRRNMNTAKAQESLGRATGIIRSQSSVITGAVLALAAVRKLYDDAIAKLTAAGDVDTTDLDAASAEASAAQAELATAIAAGTPAASEVDGEGDDADTVVPEEVDTSAVTEPAPEEAAQGGQDGQGGGGEE